MTAKPNPLPDEAAISVASSPEASIPNAVRRTLKSFAEAPRDGTPFHILNTVRFNPFAKQFEGLCYGDDDVLKWQTIRFPNNQPTWWLRQVPLPYEIPTSFAFTWTYECRRMTWRERLMKRLLGNLHLVTRYARRRAVGA
jgi:hypothetical protein